jgi:hypothetical protein
MRKGFSLLESLLASLIFLLIMCGSLEFFGTARRVFFRLRDRQENSQAVWSALEKIRSDLVSAGEGLARPMRLGLVSGIERDGDRWVLTREGKRSALTADAASGQTTLAVNAAEEDWAGRTLCLFDQFQGETIGVRNAGDGLLELESPLAHGYRGTDTVALILQKTVVYLDEGQSVLRRKADASPAQPLLENVLSFDMAFDFAKCLAELRLTVGPAPEKSYALSILARNAALGMRP